MVKFKLNRTELEELLKFVVAYAVNSEYDKLLNFERNINKLFKLLCCEAIQKISNISRINTYKELFLNLPETNAIAIIFIAQQAESEGLLADNIFLSNVMLKIDTQYNQYVVNNNNDVIVKLKHSIKLAV